MSRHVPRLLGCLMATITAVGVGQDSGPEVQEPALEQRREFSVPYTNRVQDAAATPFVGVTTDGNPIQGLYPITGEGESNSELVRAANEFLAVLTAEQRAKVMFSVDDSEWRQWANTRPLIRNGIGFDEMAEGQRDRAFDLIRAALSAKGLKTSHDIMRLNETLAELNGARELLSEWFYWITVMGEPSETEPWGWQIDGHHLIVNYFVLGNQVVMSPVFMGAEPVFAEGGAYKGTTVLVAEREKGYALYASLTEQQKETARVAGDELPEPFGRNFGRTSTELMQDNAVIPYRGIRTDALFTEQRAMLVDIIEVFIANNREGHARVRMQEIMAHIDETYFAWNEWDVALGSEDVFFFRIQSPVIIIEFDHQGTIGIPGEPADMPIRQHIHTIVRTPNGNDYGKDLLRQHYEQHPH